LFTNGEAITFHHEQETPTIVQYHCADRYRLGGGMGGGIWRGWGINMHGDIIEIKRNKKIKKKKFVK